MEADSRQSVLRLREPAMSIHFDHDAKPGTHQGVPITCELTPAESRSFLRIITRSLYVTRHIELFQMVQAEVQEFIPLRILFSAWGDFEGGELQVDVISAIPGVRTTRPADCDIERLLHDLYVRWIAHGRQPLLLHNTLGELLAESNCCCALHESLGGMGSVLVHGSLSARDGTESLYVALNTGPIRKSDASLERFRFLADLIISQLDTAFRKVAALKRHGETGMRTARQRGDLSLREQEIIVWVAKGRTNAEISGALMISEYTVKNHMRRIMKKLGASNRTEAVAMFRSDKPPEPSAPSAPARRSDIAWAGNRA